MQHSNLYIVLTEGRVQNQVLVVGTVTEAFNENEARAVGLRAFNEEHLGAVVQQQRCLDISASARAWAIKTAA